MDKKFPCDLKYSGGASGNFTCSWTLRNFGNLYNNQSFRECDMEIESMTWNLSLTSRRSQFATNRIVLSRKHFTTLFSLRNGKQLSNLKLTVTFLDTNGRKICEKHCERVGIEKVEIEMINEEDLLNELPDGDLVVVVKAAWSGSRARIVLLEKVQNEKGITSKQNVIIESNPNTNIHAKLADDMNQLLNESKSSDATVSVGDSRIPVHTVILSARSKVFKAMFEHDTTEATTRVVSITDFESASVKAMLQFIYTGHVDDVNVEKALELLKAGDKYQMDDLKTYCCNFLIGSFDKKNICHILYVADLYSVEQLKEKAMEYFCSDYCAVDLENFGFLKDRLDLIWDALKRRMKK